MLLLAGGVFSALASVVVKAASTLAAWQVAAFVFAPAFVIAAMVVAVVTVLRIRRRLEAVTDFTLALNRATLAVAVRLSEHAMVDHIYYARANGWNVTSSRDGIRFEAPDGGGEATIGLTELNWYRIAQKLHAAAPEHFPEDWLPPHVANESLNRIELGVPRTTTPQCSGRGARRLRADDPRARADDRADATLLGGRLVGGRREDRRRGLAVVRCLSA